MINIKREFLTWLDHWIASIPGEIGIYIRSKYYRSVFKDYGEGSKIYTNFKHRMPNKISLGREVVISSDVFITAGGGVEIRDFSAIGPYVKIWSTNHNFDDPDVPIIHQGSTRDKVTIGEDVWIGAGAIIKPGVTIEKGSVIAAGSVVSRSIPPFAIVAGNPSRTIGWRKKKEDDPSVGSKK